MRAFSALVTPGLRSIARFATLARFPTRTTPFHSRTSAAANLRFGRADGSIGLTRAQPPSSGGTRESRDPLRPFRNTDPPLADVWNESHPPAVPTLSARRVTRTLGLLETYFDHRG